MKPNKIRNAERELVVANMGTGEAGTRSDVTKKNAASPSAERCPSSEDGKHEYFFYLAACDEAGWQCVHCEFRPGEPAGYSPALDRKRLAVKVDGMIRDLHQAGFVNLGSNEQAYRIVRKVVPKMREAGTYDQYSIAAAILTVMAGNPTAKHGHATSSTSAST